MRDFIEGIDCRNLFLEIYFKKILGEFEFLFLRCLEVIGIKCRSCILMG